jgi:hypothetical protein
MKLINGAVTRGEEKEGKMTDVATCGCKIPFLVFEN